MYNRYVRNDAGVYDHVPTPGEQAGRKSTASDPAAPPPTPNVTTPAQGSPLSGLLGKNGLLSGILDKLHLSDIDTGDLLLLILLFLLFREGGDDELLIALGLLLIL